MGSAELKARNHFVPRQYLKEWRSAPSKLWTYRTLVSDARVPLWSQKSVSGVAYHEHLYTRAATGADSDEIERWFEREFETPAVSALSKARLGASLSAGDWTRIINYAAAQDVRTPVRLMGCLRRWRQELPELVETTLRESVELLESGHRPTRGWSGLPRDLVEIFPIQVTRSIVPSEARGTIQAELFVGRALWLFGIRHLLTTTIEILHRHRWTVLRAPEGVDWITSDNPFLRLNYESGERYGFGGGWGSVGTELIMPISPSHILYTKVGARPLSRGAVVPHSDAIWLQKFFAKNAHRLVFAASVNQDVAGWRPRITDADAVKAESEQWRRWHREQTAAERALIAMKDAEEKDERRVGE